jgi:hypothetical protein
MNESSRIPSYHVDGPGATGRAEAFDRSVHSGFGEVVDRGAIEVGELGAGEIARPIGGLDAEGRTVRGQRGDGPAKALCDERGRR